MAGEIGVGIIGFGMAARVFHVPIIRSIPELSLKGIVTAQTADVQRLFPEVKPLADTGSLIADDGVRLLIVATPTNTHFDLARQGLIARKNVVVEKPFTATSSEADELIHLAAREGCILSVFQNRRWDGDFLTIRKVLDGGLLGRLVEYESHFDRFRDKPRVNWRETAIPGGGLLFDLGSHLIDQALVLFGLPLAVTADIRRQRNFGEADDHFDLRLDYDHLEVTLKSGMLVRERSPRFVLHGDAGSFVKYGLDPQEEAMKRGGSPTDPNWGEEAPDQWGHLIGCLNGLMFDGKVCTLAGCYQAYYRNVVDAIRGRAELAVKPEDARTVIRIIEHAVESSARRRTIPFSTE